MKRVKVLFVTTWYPTRENPVGGVFVREHAKAVKLSDDVIVLHCGRFDPNLKELWRMEEEVDENLTQSIPTFQLRYRQSPIPRTAYSVYLWTVLRGFQKITAEGPCPDIIHAHNYEAGVPAILIGKLYRIPIVITEHSTEFPRRILRRRDIWKSHFAFNRADAVLPVSKSLQRAIEEYGIEARFHVVANVVDRNLFYPDSSAHLKNPTKHLLTVALLDASHKKGMPFLLNALAHLYRRRDDWHLNMVGDGPARAEYEGLAVDSGLANKVTFHGLKAKSEVAEFMRQADLLVLPSLFETFSVVAAEALTTGTPVLTTRCGGPEEYINEDVGLVVPPADAEALCEGLDYMLDHLEKFNPSKISRYAIERFSPDRIGKQLHGIYLECIKKYMRANATTV